ncbi:hypothetical protein Ddye_024660 [Dipteronia dyeriana]|uniref:Exostosin GT47 domain-containing protein n=1 Tax=Dipteronia dyeriana TaxID=168575 RepID=A0AAD9TVS2_9ROSI|nr:hypothetical protein Ddye_024660 [Dipteronia dyeriana]
MERTTVVGSCRHHFWYFIFTIFALWFLYLNYFFYSSAITGKNHEASGLLAGNDTDTDTAFGDNDQELLSDSIHLKEDSNEDGNDSENVDDDSEDGFNPVDSFLKLGNWVQIADEILASEKKLERQHNINRARKHPGTLVRKRPGTRHEEKPDSRRSRYSVRNRNRRGRSSPVVERKPVIGKKPVEVVKPDPVYCKGKYIYVYRLPMRYNDDLIRHCKNLSEWTNMCKFTSNMGLGPVLENNDNVYSNTSWFATNQFLLEVIFHNRMKQYKCLTRNSSLASAIFVPFYPGLDLNRYLWSRSTMKLKDNDTFDLVKWLKQRPEWKRMSGRDHFMVAGRISWDFRRDSNNDFDWGNKLLLLPETKNMTMLVIESSPWHTNDFAIPYPTYFHPSTDEEVFEWQSRMRNQTRPFLFSFVGAGRPNLPDSIRTELMDQCRSSKKCRLMECVKGFNKCYNPEYVMRMFQNSVFCLQPAGDSFTRRSTFDSILAGCIPVFFNPGSAYVQYVWHLPKNYSKYSVFIPDTDVKDKISIEKTLERITKEQVEAMREEVIKLMPKVIYADPNGRLETLEDAFDITVEGVLERIDKMRQEMNEGRKHLSTDLAGEDAWKYNLFGTIDEHEWDHFFARPRIY